MVEIWIKTNPSDLFCLFELVSYCWDVKVCFAKAMMYFSSFQLSTFQLKYDTIKINFDEAFNEKQFL